MLLRKALKLLAVVRLYKNFLSNIIKQSLAFLQASEILVDSLAYAHRLLMNTGPRNTLKMEAESCPAINGTVCQSIRRHILQDLNLYHCHCDELKRYALLHSSTETTERSALVEEDVDVRAASVSAHFQTSLAYVE